MKKIKFFILLFVFSQFVIAQVTPAEKAALLAFYNATDGPNWVSENDANLTNDWDFTGPVTDDWFGITINGGHVIALDLNPTDDVAGSNNLTGTLPNEIGNLQWLEILDLTIGNLTGPIPLSITTLTNVQLLNLSKNNFTGTIPVAIGNLTQLRTLLLGQNKLTGEIPLSVTTFTNLEILSLRNNNLSGEIPVEITNMLTLKSLQLGSNQFTGYVYPEYGNLTGLNIFGLEYNLLTGAIPTELGNLVDIVDFRIGNQNLTGTLPVSLRNLVQATNIHIDNTSISGEIPLEYGQLINIELFLLSENNLTGPIPDSFNNLTSIKWLDLRNNQLSGAIPDTFSNLTQLENLFLDFNEFTGSIPNSITSLVNLINFSFSNNQLTGNIPPGITSLMNLQTLYLQNNQLEGTIPNFTSLPDFRTLVFNNNQYQFGDFENQFDQYSINLPIFSDNPQSKVNEIESLSRNIGENITLITTVSGAQNHYKWFKDGVAIPDAPDSPSLTLNNVKATDTGVYHAEITSDVVTDLTLVRNDITLTIGCVTPIVDDPQDVTACGSYTLPILSNDNYYFTDTNAGGTQLNEGDLITASQILYVYAGVSGCSNENSFDIQIDSPTLADNPQDVTACGSYTLPTLSNFNYYYTYPNAGGTQLSAGDIITASQILYVYAGVSGCSNESSFDIQIDSPTLIDSILDVEVCENYALPILNNGNYFTQTNGTGAELFAGDIINVSLTVYIYNESASCSNENSFTITIAPLLCEETPEPEISCTIDFPNFFTPNNDGANDNYVPITDVCSPGGTLSIFDRYAKLVFQTNSLYNTWDGTYNGKPLPSSDYWYRFENIENKEVITGHFALKR